MTATKRNWLPLFTPYVVEDYPYGFNKRTTMTYHIEFKPKKGFRVWQTTVNPTTWRINATKYSTYNDFFRLYIDDATWHVKAWGFDSNTKLENYERALGSGIFDDVPTEVFDHKRAMAMTLWTSIRWMTSFQWWEVNWVFDEETLRIPPTLTDDDKKNLEKIDFDKILPIYKRINEEYEANEALRQSKKAFIN